MNICAIDCSSVSCSVCILQDGKVLSSVYQNTGLTHSQTLLVNIRFALQQAGMTVADMDQIAVTTGPGSFTGIKIGVATAKGLAFAKDIECVGISSLQAAAAVGLLDEPDKPCQANVSADCCTSPETEQKQLQNGRIIIAVMDARRNMFYNANFRLNNHQMIRLCEDRQIGFEELLQQADPDSLVIGDGADLFCRLAQERGRTFFKAGAHLKYIHAETVALLAWKGYGTHCSAMQLQPVYLRPSQAERERLEKLKKESST